jgi:hypothetical protein
VLETVDQALRCATALSCHVPQVALELRLNDGRIARVSHEPAFRPVLPPCALRAALVTVSRPAWCALIEGVDLGGPFVEIHESGDTVIVGFESGATAVSTFATTAPPCLLALWMETARPPGIDTALIDGRLHVDPELGTVVVRMESDGLSAQQLSTAAAWVAPQVQRLATP